MAPVAIVLTVIAAFVIGAGANSFTKTVDSPIEQMAEAIIERETGIKTDFSADDKARAAIILKEQKELELQRRLEAHTHTHTGAVLVPSDGKVVVNPRPNHFGPTYKK